MNKYFCVVESYDWIYIGDNENELNYEEKDLLIKYLENTIKSDKNIIEEKYKKIRFINYVGIINIKNVTIEIIPKICLNEDENKEKKVLLHMISKCNDFDINLDTIINTKRENYNLIEHILNKFVDVLLKEINKGLYRQYVDFQSDLSCVKGKIVFKENIKNTCSRKTKMHCKFEEYSEDNTINHILKLACIKYLNTIQNYELQNKFKKAVFHLGNVSTIQMNNENIKKCVVNKQSKRFEKALELAKFILLNLSNQSTIGNSRGFSMLFDMDLLFEKYISKITKKLSSNLNKRAIYKDKRNYLLINQNNDKNEFNLVPDLVIEQNNITDLIIDIKWKCVEENSKLTYNISDIYEMYAYINSYKDAKRIILLYPYMGIDREYPKWQLFDNSNKCIEIKTVRLDEYDNTLEDLSEIISS